MGYLKRIKHVFPSCDITTVGAFHWLYKSNHTKCTDFFFQSVHQNLSVDCLNVDGDMEDSQLLLDDAIRLKEELTNTTAVRHNLHSDY